MMEHRTNGRGDIPLSVRHSRAAPPVLRPMPFDMASIVPIANAGARIAAPAPRPEPKIHAASDLLADGA
ncbi:hypothetical protein [Stappia sp.]|uniref:hypothetical protein n=1 Tax=Stappia sp. TaxID=1870903 RepID=UPI0032D8D82E